jgi:hypothetical protein
VISAQVRLERFSIAAITTINSQDTSGTMRNVDAVLGLAGPRAMYP